MPLRPDLPPRRAPLWPRLFLPVCAVAVLLSGACDREGREDAAVTGDGSRPPAPATTRAGSAAVAATGPAAAAGFFTEVTGHLGFDPNPPRYPDGTYMTPEITPGGVALFDYDNDGRLDVLLVRHPPPGPYPAAFKAAAPNRLFRQKPDGTFAEVAGAAGLGGKGYHHGVAVGDVNNDGFPDVYVCNYGGGDEFFLNNGNGTFTDATAKSGFASPQANPLLTSEQNWSSTAAFFDLDRDGHLDLWVVHFATFNPKKVCKGTAADEPDYCGPHTFPGQLATLYRNNGDGTFADVTRKAGVDAPGRGWGVIAADLTGDGWPDVLQANDEEPNQLWVNQGDGTFVDEALLRGCAFNAAGSVEANMGVTVGDVLNRGNGGAFDVYITHISSETNTLWRALGDGQYTDVTPVAGMAAIDRPFTGWGCGFFDYDNDGHLDLAIANGRVARGPVRPEASGLGPFWSRFAEPNLLFRGDASGRFADVSNDAGDFTKKLEVHRALAFADLHNRGAVDLVTVNLDNTLRVHRNDAAKPGQAGHHWLQVLPMTGKRDAIGAKVFVTTGGKTRVGLCLRAYSYLASNDPRVHFGLGATEKVDGVEVEWPSGAPKRERFETSGINRVLVVRQGEGKQG